MYMVDIIAVLTNMESRVRYRHASVWDKKWQKVPHLICILGLRKENI